MARLRIDERAGAQPGIVDAVRQAFDQAPGEWTITIVPILGFSPPWWNVTAKGPGELVLEVPFMPSQQQAEVVRERLTQALRAHGVIP